MASPTALIVGAGIGGLAAAVALGRSGWTVRVFERSATTEQTGFALSLAPNAMAALTELGVDRRIRECGHVPGQIDIRRADGARLRRFDLGGFWRPEGPTMFFALRAALHDVLLQGVGAECIELNAGIVGYQVEGNRVIVTTADNRSVSGDVLIGADGVGSSIRRLLHPSEPPPRRSGYWAVRGLARNADQHLGPLSGVLYLGGGIEAAAINAGMGAVYWYASLLARDRPAGPQDPQWLLDRYPGMKDPTFTSIVHATAPADVRLDELYERAPLEWWGQGPVTLLGDAAHPVLPHTGQGAALALEDAVALALALRTGDHLAGLRRYESVRRPLTARVIRSGPRIARTTTTHSRVVAATRNAVVRLLPTAAIGVAVRAAARRDPHRRLR